MHSVININDIFGTPTWSNLASGCGQCEMFQWHICGNKLGMVVLSPSHTQDIGHQGCTRTAHGSPIINFISTH
jgi:hypothetical protein